MNQRYDSLDEGMHLNEYLAIILSRWKVALAGFLVIFSGVAIVTFATRPIYQAFSTLQVGAEKTALKVGSPYEQPSNSIDTEIQILLSRTIAEEAARRIHMDCLVTNNSNDLVFKIADFSAEEKNTPYRVELTGSDTFRVKDAGNNEVGSGKSGVPMKGKRISLTFTDLRGKAGDSFVLTALPLDKIATNILTNTRASQVGQNTNVLRLSYTDPDPKLAAALVNSIAQVYIEMAVSLKSLESSKSVTFIDQQLKSMQEDLDKAEQKLKAFKVSSGIVNLDAEGTKVFTKIAEADKQKTQSWLTGKQLEFAMNSLKDAMKSGRPYSPSDPVGGMVTAKLAELESQKKALLVEYTDAHPRVRAIQDQIDGTKRNLLELYESSLKNLARQETMISPLISGYEGELRSLPEKERELASLMRQAKVTNELYTALLQKHQELRVTTAATVSNISILDPAVPPQTPIKPNKRKNITMGLLFGIVVGLGLALLLEYMDDTIKNAEEAKRELELPILATIPFIKSKGEGAVNNDRGASLISFYDPKSAVSESFRSLRTGIHFSAVNRKRQVLMITSSFPGEGKTTIIGNLAVILSQAGSRTILIDCDMRRPSLHELFDHSQRPGLSEILAGDADMGSLIHTTGIPQIDLISAGTIPPNPAELLGSNAMRDLIVKLRESYDTVMLDSPPVLSVTDASVLTTMSDMVFVVVESGRVPRKAARQMLETLQNIGAPLAGIIFNNKKERVRHGYGYYGDGYTNYYEETPAVAKRVWWRRWLNI